MTKEEFLREAKLFFKEMNLKNKKIKSSLFFIEDEEGKLAAWINGPTKNIIEYSDKLIKEYK